MEKPIDSIHSDRSHAVINNLVPMIALAKELQWEMSKLVQWHVDKYYERGYHDLWVGKHGWGNIEAYATFFAKGRKLVSDHVHIVKHHHTLVVEAAPWYLMHDVDSLFFYDIELADLLVFIKELATAHAKLCGIAIEIMHQSSKEVTAFMKEMH